MTAIVGKFVSAPVQEWVANAAYFEFCRQRIAYWTAGTGKPLLLIHGYPTSSWDWSWLWPHLARTRQVIACDMVGFGLSNKPASGHSIMAQADLQEALLEHLDVHEYDAVVHDYGVSVGQELLARTNEGRVSQELGRMVFLNGGLFPELHRLEPLQRLGVSPVGFLLGLLINRRRFGQAFANVFGPESKPTEQELDAHWYFISRNDGHRFAHKLLHYIAERQDNRGRWVAALQFPSVPILLVNGGKDPVSGKHVFDHFRDLVPDQSAVLLSDTGHYPHTENPSAVFKELTAFLSLTE